VTMVALYTAVYQVKHSYLSTGTLLLVVVYSLQSTECSTKRKITSDNGGPRHCSLPGKAQLPFNRYSSTGGSLQSTVYCE